MKIKSIEIRAQRWPWQEGPGHRIALFNPKGARFGGGWNYKLGIDIGGSTIILNLIWGMIRIDRRRP